MNVFIIFLMIALGTIMALTRFLDWIVWPLWLAGVLLVMVLIFHSEHAADDQFASHTGSDLRLAMLTSGLYYLLAGAAARILRSSLRNNVVWQRLALGISITLLILPFAIVLTLELSRT